MFSYLTYGNLSSGTVCDPEENYEKKKIKERNIKRWNEYKRYGLINLVFVSISVDFRFFSPSLHLCKKKNECATQFLHSSDAERNETQRTYDKKNDVNRNQNVNAENIII